MYVWLQIVLTQWLHTQAFKWFLSTNFRNIYKVLYNLSRSKCHSFTSTKLLTKVLESTKCACVCAEKVMMLKTKMGGLAKGMDRNEKKENEVRYCFWFYYSYSSLTFACILFVHNFTNTDTHTTFSNYFTINNCNCEHNHCEWSHHHHQPSFSHIQFTVIVTLNLPSFIPNESS